MVPNFILSLSASSIKLFHLEKSTLNFIGDADPADPKFKLQLKELVQKGVSLSPDGIHCDILLPNEHIKYLTLTNPKAPHSTVSAALEGATPYALNELEVSHQTHNKQTYIAAVAKETLSEAEQFAVTNGFKPLSFIANFDDENDILNFQFGNTHWLKQNTLASPLAASHPVQDALSANTPALSAQSVSPQKTSKTKPQISTKKLTRKIPLWLILTAGLIALFILLFFLTGQKPQTPTQIAPPTQPTHSERHLPPEQNSKALQSSTKDPDVKRENATPIQNEPNIDAPETGIQAIEVENTTLTQFKPQVSAPKKPALMIRNRTDTAIQALNNESPKETRAALPWIKPTLQKPIKATDQSPNQTFKLPSLSVFKLHDISDTDSSKNIEAPIPKTEGQDSGEADTNTTPPQANFITQDTSDPLSSPGAEAQVETQEPATTSLTELDAQTVSDTPNNIASIPRPQLRPKSLPPAAPIIDVSTAKLRPKMRPNHITTAPKANATLPSNTEENRETPPRAPTQDTTLTSVLNNIIASAPESAAALTSTPRPKARPANIKTAQRSASQASARASTSRNTQAEQRVSRAATTTSAGNIPRSVARNATISSALNGPGADLIGIYGSSKTRRALVRLDNNTYVKVSVGSTFDGGQVVSIGERTLNYVKNGTTYTLQVPAG